MSTTYLVDTTYCLDDQQLAEVQDWATKIGLDIKRFCAKNEIVVDGNAVKLDVFTSWPARLGSDGEPERKRITVPLTAPIPSALAKLAAA